MTELLQKLMGIASAVVALVALVGLVAVLAALVNRRRSIPLAVAMLPVAAFTAVGAWYSWAETHSVAWTLGYGAVAVVSLVGLIRQFVVGNEHR
jgi:hypothetical protein